MHFVGFTVTDAGGATLALDLTSAFWAPYRDQFVAIEGEAERLERAREITGEVADELFYGWLPLDDDKRAYDLTEPPQPPTVTLFVADG